MWLKPNQLVNRTRSGRPVSANVEMSALRAVELPLWVAKASIAFLESRRGACQNGQLAVRSSCGHYNSSDGSDYLFSLGFLRRTPQGEVLFRSEFSPALRAMLAGTEVDRREARSTYTWTKYPCAEAVFSSFLNNPIS